MVEVVEYLGVYGTVVTAYAVIALAETARAFKVSRRDLELLAVGAFKDGHLYIQFRYLKVNIIFQQLAEVYLAAYFAVSVDRENAHAHDYHYYSDDT